jgi:membrane AbrB-like protein
MVRHLSAAPRWVFLLITSVVIAALMQQVHLPAALFLGPLVGGIIFGARGTGLKVPQRLFFMGMAGVGTMMGNLTSSESLNVFMHKWPLFLSIIFTTIFASSVLGFVLTRLRVLPGSVAVWGTSVGASLPMIILAEAHGTDPRLIAFMHYIRVILAAAVSTLLARFWLGVTPGAAHHVEWFPPIDWLRFLETVAIAGTAAYGGMKLRIPAGQFLGPCITIAVLKGLGLFHAELPYALLAGTYAVIGWSLGLNFTREILLYSFRLLPQIIGSIAFMICICMGLAAALVYGAGIDPVTAYLATSPGSTDSIAIIAAETKTVDASFVTAMQIIRMFVLLFMAPSIASMVARFAVRSMPERG